MRMNSRAMDRFETVEWDVIAERMAERTVPHMPSMGELVESIRECGADRLAGFTSMHDLAVTTAPVPDRGPIEVIWVRPRSGNAVLVEHWSVTGHDDRILRDGSEAARLFWRFVIEKFGIEPVRSAQAEGLGEDPATASR